MSSSQPPPQTKAKDVVFVHSPTADGNGANVLRSREDRLEIGTVRPLEDGKAINGEVVKLKSRKESTRLFDVETEVGAPTNANRNVAGPAQVASDSYRKNWDAIWASRKKPELLN